MKESLAASEGGQGRREAKCVIHVQTCSLKVRLMSLRWPFTEDTRQASVKHEHLYLIYILTICT